MVPRLRASRVFGSGHLGGTREEGPRRGRAHPRAPRRIRLYRDVLRPRLDRPSEPGPRAEDRGRGARHRLSRRPPPPSLRDDARGVPRGPPKEPRLAAGDRRKARDVLPRAGVVDEEREEPRLRSPCRGGLHAGLLAHDGAAGGRAFESGAARDARNRFGPDSGSPAAHGHVLRLPRDMGRRRVRAPHAREPRFRRDRAGPRRRRLARPLRASLGIRRRPPANAGPLSRSASRPLRGPQADGRALASPARAPSLWGHLVGSSHFCEWEERREEFYEWEEGRSRGLSAPLVVTSASSSAFAALFPGQLSEKAGMGEALARRYDFVPSLFEEISRRSGVRIADTFFGEGDPSLHSDLPAQVGVFAVSLPAVEGALAALTPDRARLAIATENAAAQFILTGERALVAAAVEELRPKALKTDLLSIRIPMHTSRLEAVCQGLQSFLKRGVNIAQPRSALFAPMLGRRVDTAEEAADVLSKQLCRPSVFGPTLQAMREGGLRRFAEVGPGDVLTRLVRWTVRDAQLPPNALEDPESIEAFAKSLAPPPLFPFKENSIVAVASARPERLGSETK